MDCCWVERCRINIWLPCEREAYHNGLCVKHLRTWSERERDRAREEAIRDELSNWLPG
jgi:hypothetical protein